MLLSYHGNFPHCERTVPLSRSRSYRSHIKVSTFNKDTFNIIDVNTNKEDDTDINLLILKSLSEINENMKENQSANKSVSKKVDETNLIDFTEPEINNVEKKKYKEK